MDELIKEILDAWEEVAEMVIKETSGNIATEMAELKAKRAEFEAKYKTLKAGK